MVPFSIWLVFLLVFCHRDGRILNFYQISDMDIRCIISGRIQIIAGSDFLIQLHGNKSSSQDHCIDFVFKFYTLTLTANVYDNILSIYYKMMFCRVAHMTNQCDQSAVDCAEKWLRMQACLSPVWNKWGYLQHFKGRQSSHCSMVIRHQWTDVASQMIMTLQLSHSF